MIISTDSMGKLNLINHDFMFRAVILFAQITTGEILNKPSSPKTIHCHISCPDCLREIEEPI